MTAHKEVVVATIKMEPQKDKEFTIVGRKFVRFSHRRNNCLPNAQVKGAKNVVPYFWSQKNYLLTQKVCLFGPGF